MAVEALYGNSNEPKFPFDHVIEHLSWLPTRMSAAEESPEEFIALINTILVFGRGRTSCMNYIRTWKACSELVSCLNATLENIGGLDALHHRIELVRRGPSQFFVTCTLSPRFHWKARLTHPEVGRNLDFFAAGHMFSPPFPPRASFKFMERKTMSNLFGEGVSLESLEGDVFREQLQDFNDTKEELFNDIMEQFGLPYRFKWVLNAPDERRETVAVLKESSPPTCQWWDDNCLLVNGPGDPDRSIHFEFCNFDTEFHENWLLIQHIYFFSLKYTRFEYRNIESQCNFNYWRTMQKIFRDVQKTIERPTSPEECDNIKKQLKELADAAEAYDPPVNDDWDGAFQPDPIPSPFLVRFWNYLLRRKRFLVYRAWVALQEMKMQVFQRWKLRKPLVHSGFELPYGATADKYWF
jgi:hypothetical protein